MAMTTLLTLAAMFGAVRQNTPRVGGGGVGGGGDDGGDDGGGGGGK